METIGKLIDGTQDRDAIHVAVAPVVAYHTLRPGEHIGFVKDDNRTVGNLAGKLIGIVDPFLTKHVRQGQQFWMFLYPNTITSLKHSWTHPDFNAEADKVNASKEWISSWAATYRMSYDRAMESAHTGNFFLGELCNDHIPVEFWDHYKIITGRQVSDEIREGTYFRCAC